MEVNQDGQSFSGASRLWRKICIPNDFDPHGQREPGRLSDPLDPQRAIQTWLSNWVHAKSSQISAPGVLSMQPLHPHTPWLKWLQMTVVSNTSHHSSRKTEEVEEKKPWCSSICPADLTVMGGNGYSFYGFYHMWLERKMSLVSNLLNDIIQTPKFIKPSWPSLLRIQMCWKKNSWLDATTYRSEGQADSWNLPGDLV